MVCRSGWGICIAYGVYAKKKDDVVLATTVQGFGDMSVAMLAAVAILPGLFSVLGEQGALDACASGNNGLAFIALTGVFETMAGGRIFACLFWIALICASITSIIAMYSIVVQPLADAGISKKKACIIMGVITIALGIPSAWSNFVFCNQDFVVGQAMVIGATFSGYALLKFGPEKVRTKFLNHPNTSLHIGKRFNWGAAILLPVLAVVMFVWWCIQYIGWEPNWWKPFEMYSLGSMLWQLGIPMILFAVFNKRSRPPPARSISTARNSPTSSITASIAKGGNQHDCNFHYPDDSLPRWYLGRADLLPDPHDPDTEQVRQIRPIHYRISSHLSMNARPAPQAGAFTFSPTARVFAFLSSSGFIFRMQNCSFSSNGADSAFTNI